VEVNRSSSPTATRSCRPPPPKAAPPRRHCRRPRATPSGD